MEAGWLVMSSSHGAVLVDDTDRHIPRSTLVRMCVYRYNLEDIFNRRKTVANYK